MADLRVHPAAGDPPPSHSSASSSPVTSGEHPKPPLQAISKPIPPPPASHVVQLPREQIFRYPPQENAGKFQTKNLRKNRRSCCRRCCCFSIFLLLLLIISAAVSAGVLYLIFRFKSPKYTVTNLAVNGMNLTSTSPISPEFNVSLRFENPNDKMGVYCLKGSAVKVFYNDVKLSDGVLPVFYQPSKNLTVVHVIMTGPDIVLGGTVKTALRNAQNQRRVPFAIRFKVPVRFKVGSAKTWDMTVKVKCDVVLDALNVGAKIVSNKCDKSVRFW